MDELGGKKSLTYDGAASLVRSAPWGRIAPYLPRASSNRFSVRESR